MSHSGEVNLSSDVKIPTLSHKTREGWGTPLNLIPFDPEFAAGAFNAVRVCLRVLPEEQVCVITDEATFEIAAAIAAELEKVGAPYHGCRCWRDFGTASVAGFAAGDSRRSGEFAGFDFAVQAQANELRSRIQMTDVVNRKKIRHAHMVNINRQIMLEGMRADFEKD